MTDANTTSHSARKRWPWQKLAWTVAAIFVLAVVLFWPADPVRTTSQKIYVQLTTADRPVPGVEVSLQCDFALAEPPASPAISLFADPGGQARDFREEYPWRSAVTDENGRACIAIEYAAPDRTWGSKPPEWRDETGKYYRMKLKRGQGEEEFSILLTHGNCLMLNSASTRIYGYVSLAVERPRYVDSAQGSAA
jgi:hypothetical protein